VDARGNIKKAAPNKMNSANASTEYCVGESCGFESCITDYKFLRYAHHVSMSNYGKRFRLSVV